MAISLAEAEELAKVEAASSRLDSKKRQDAASTFRPAAGTRPMLWVGSLPGRSAAPPHANPHGRGRLVRDNLHGLEIDERC